MSKFTALLLCVILCLAMCSCSGNDAVNSMADEENRKIDNSAYYEEVKKELVGEWGYMIFDGNHSSATVLEFRENGTGQLVMYNLSSNDKKVEGVTSWKLTYTIKKNQIVCEQESYTSKSGYKTVIYDYTYEDGIQYISINNNYRVYHKDNWYDEIIEPLRMYGASGLSEKHMEYIDYDNLSGTEWHK